MMLAIYLSIVLSCTVLLAGGLNEIDQKLDASLLWGPYRPNLYLGIRPRIPHSLLSGLLWFNLDDYNGLSKLRHSCEQSDNMGGFGWVKYDPRTGGRQIIKDNDCKIKLITDFVKTEDGNWGLEIRGVPMKGYEKVKTSMVFYTGLEGEGLLTSPSDSDTVEGDIELVGYSEKLGGGFTIKITEEGLQNKKPKAKKLIETHLDPSKTHYVSLHVPDDNVWQAKDIFMTLLQQSIEDLATKYLELPDIPVDQLYSLRNMNDFSGNLHFIQKTFVGGFKFFVTFNKEMTNDIITAENIPVMLKSATTHFDARFSEKFEFQPPFTSNEFQKFGKDFLSNLMGGIGYFYGDSLVDREDKLDEITFASHELVGEIEPPQELFTAVPSRPFFPRGFYWDEGFHLLPILEYDSSLALEVLKSWFDLIDDNGWIAREQILGPEARSKVPADFQVQNPNIANPPTMMLVFTKLLEDAKEVHQMQLIAQLEDEMVYGGFDSINLADVYLENPKLLIDYGNEVYPKLQKHYEWFRRTQAGDLELYDRHPTFPDEAYRWRGRTISHCLPSGLDDYPRAEAPDTAELNVDLISWIGVMTRSMKTMAELLEKKDDAAKYAKIEKLITKNIEDIHWSEANKCYCDVTLDEDDKDIFVCHKGYVSLFPFIHKFVPANSTKLYHLIKLIRDPEELWSNYGIRSLSKTSPFFHTAEDYWRGNIWINMNYLILDALSFYAKEPETNPKLKVLISLTYKQLRENLVDNIYNNWKKSGYAYEQYQELDGRGTRTRHFLGWTSLAVLIMKMPEEV